MKKAILIAVFCLFCANAKAQVPYIEEVKALGSVAGQGMACGASRYDTFESLARTILITKAPSDKIQSTGMYEYNQAKADAYISKQMDGFYDCSNINRRFDSQAIFDMKVYEDGTIQMPDGKIYAPRTPYDATLVYNKQNKIKENAKAIYDGGSREAKGFQITSEGVDGVNNIGAVPNVPEVQEVREGTVITRDDKLNAMNVAQPVQNNEPTIKRIKSTYR